MSALLILAVLFGGPVNILVRPSFAIAPGSFQATIIIQRDARNRSLEWGYRHGEFIVSASTLSIDGAQRQRVFVPKPWEQLPGGDYIAYAKLTRIDHGRTVITQAEQAFRSVYPEDF